MKKYLKSTEIRDLFSCSLETVRSWRRKENLSFVKKGRECKFEIKILLDWLRSSQRNEYADLLFDYVANMGKPKKRKTSAKVKKAKSISKGKKDTVKKAVPKKSHNVKLKDLAEKSKLTEKEIEVNSVDMFGQGYILSRLFETRSIEMQAENNPTQAARFCSLLTQLAETCRKNELAKLDIDLRCGNVVPTQYVISFIGKMATSIKTEALALPGALDEKLAAESDSKKVREILEDSIYSLLRHLSKEFQR